MHMVAFGPVLVMPSGHGEQPRSVVSVGAAETNWPLGQSIHAVHELALTVVVKPLVQCVQVLSVVGSPIIDR